MHRIVAGAFKAIFMSILFVIIFDVLFYIARVEMLNQRIESTMVTMQQEVSKNNYLPVDSYIMYEGILRGIATDMNGSQPGSFVNGFNINYNHNCNSAYSQAMRNAGLTPSVKLNTPANYGDVAVIELTVQVNALTWGYNRSADGAANESNHYYLTRNFTYTYQVPCLRYISVTK